MPRIRIKQDDQKQRKSISEAQKIFIMHCKLKNLAPYTIKYYEENLNFFQPSSPLIKNVDEITQDVIDSYPPWLDQSAVCDAADVCSGADSRQERSIGKRTGTA